MRIYIAYKYRMVPDKQALQQELQSLSDYFNSLGHKSFILGRDVQKWARHGYSKLSTLMDIIKHIGKQDLLFVYINSNVHTNGIPVEFALAKLNGLKVVVARQKNLKKSILEGLTDKVIVFSDLNDLKKQAQQVLS